MKIDDAGLHLTVKGQAQILDVDHIVICAGQEPPVATSEGKWLHRDDAGNYWRVFPFYDNTFAPEHLPEPAVAFEAARAYGAFLYALRDFPANELVETIPGFHDTERRWAVLKIF
jgi:hypothetical protein